LLNNVDLILQKNCIDKNDIKIIFLLSIGEKLKSYEADFKLSHLKFDDAFYKEGYNLDMHKNDR
jgi:hypothetical protein